MHIGHPSLRSIMVVAGLLILASSVVEAGEAPAMSAQEVINKLPVQIQPAFDLRMRLGIEVASRAGDQWKATEAKESDYRAASDGRVDVISTSYRYGDSGRQPAISARSIWNGTQYQYRQESLSPSGGRSQVWAAVSLREEHIERTTTSVYQGAFLRGIFLGDNQPVAKLLQGATALKIQNQQERIGGNACYIVEAQTPHGTYKLWIDPSAGWNIRKALIRKRKGDLFFGKPISPPQDKAGLAEIELLLDEVQVERFGNQYLPTAATLYQIIRRSDGQEEHFRFAAHAKVEINPDWKQLKAFIMDGIPEGNPVDHEDLPGLQYIWHQGQAVLKVQDEAIRTIDAALEAAQVVPATAPATSPASTAPHMLQSSTSELDTSASPITASANSRAVLMRSVVVLILVAMSVGIYRRWRSKTIR